ncbi:hypothetical protein RRG08_060019 [Elysia crispata]|uniref:Uncharacterized protein n=1 Tax=Elysia crispata TaxID=231223 RepID=A0AAE0YE70_9GAST|nr:hypothetical protein RRG08_060019 [Elysia crispata]
MLAEGSIFSTLSLSARVDLAYCEYSVPGLWLTRGRNKHLAYLGSSRAQPLVHLAHHTTTVSIPSWLLTPR